MPAYPFLSPGWIAAAREIHDDFKDRLDDPEEPVRINVVVTDAPFSDAPVTGHVDTTTGSAVPQEGLIEDPDVAVRLPYEIAQQLFVDMQPEAVMIAFMSGDIEVEGDITLLMNLQDIEPTPDQQALATEVSDRLHAITE